MATCIAGGINPMATQASCATTDPSAITCVQGGAPSAVLSSSGSNPLQSNKPTQITNPDVSMANMYKQDNGGLFARGGFVRGYASGGLMKGYAAGGNTGFTQSFCNELGYCVTIPDAAAPLSQATGHATTCGGSGTGVAPSACTAPAAAATNNAITCNASSASRSLGTQCVPTGCSTAACNATIQKQMATNATNPTLPAGTQQVATLINNSACQELCKCAYNVSGNGLTVNAATGGNAATAANPTQIAAAGYNSAQLNPNCTPQVAAAQGSAQNAQETNAPQINTSNPAYTITAAQGQVDPNAVVSNQVANLTQCLKPCAPLPAWANPSVNLVNSQMAARGLGASSITAGNEITALQSAALPIAQSNASYYANLDLANLSNQQQAVVQNAQIQASMAGENLTVAQQAAQTNAQAFLQMDLANLTNEQQAAVLNAQQIQQTLLSDQSAANAAAQFNASSVNSTNQFMANLSSQVALSNAAQQNAMTQFNVGQTNSVNEFNSNLQNQINQFNATNQLAIDTSNVTWRRNINTLNTAAVNAANQTNAQNLLNLSTTAQNNLWQQWQDEASWANTDTQNADTRNQNLAIAALGQQTAFDLQSAAGQQQLFNYLGQFGLKVTGGLLGGSSSSSSTDNNNTGSTDNNNTGGAGTTGGSKTGTCTGCTPAEGCGVFCNS